MEAKAREAWSRFIREEQTRALRFGPKSPKPLDEKRKLPKQEVPAVSITTPDELERYVGEFKPAFRYRSTMQQALLYLLGLLSDLGHKNGETIEAAIPGATQQGVWDFLVRSPWSAEALDQSRVAHFVRTCGIEGHPMDVIIDEVSQVKQGKKSVGVTRQYLGCVGKTANGQVTVSLHGLVGEYDLPLTGQLYLPEAWLREAEQRQQARIPEDVGFTTKPEIAQQLLQRVAEWGVPIARVYGDPGYGDVKMMCALERAGFPYCLGVRSTLSVRLPEESLPPPPAPPAYKGTGRPPKTPEVRPFRHTVAEIRQAWPQDAWQRVAYRQGVDGSILQREFVALRVRAATQTLETGDVWLLLERPLDPASDDTKQYVLTAPVSATLDELAQFAHRRPIIERNSYENGKGEIGLADYQGRSWKGYHHHLAMAWLALTWLHLHRNRLPEPPDDRGGSALSPAAPSHPGSPAETHPATPPSLCLALPTGRVPILVSSLATYAIALPRQVWESVQAVRRRLSAWFRAMTHIELLLAGVRPHLPLLTPCAEAP